METDSKEIARPESQLYRGHSGQTNTPEAHVIYMWFAYAFLRGNARPEDPGRYLSRTRMGRGEVKDA